MADESILSGGISNSVAETPILPVQGGGGLVGGMNTSEISLLDGGIGEIKVVEGGGEPSSDIQIVQHYDILDIELYNNFVKKFSPTTKIDNAIKNIKIPDEKILHYGVKGAISVLNSKNIQNLVQIKIIPITTKKLVILPPFDKPEDYIKQFMFLIANDYMEIDSKNNFVIRKNVFVISLAPFKDEALIKYFYHKLKSTNTLSYYVVGKLFNAFIHPKEKGILVTSQGFNLSKPVKPEDLEPTNFEVINEYNIKSMKYKVNPSATYTIDTITNGEDTENPTTFTFTLKTHIAVISLIDEDIQTINVDLQGNKYRIRIPYVNNKTDKIYHDWENNIYKMDEEKLVKDLHLILTDGIPKFLFNLAYFKCFDDVSLLTKAECSSMKITLDTLYKRALHNYEKGGDSDSEDEDEGTHSHSHRHGREHEHEHGSKVITSIECNQIDTEDPKKVRCIIKYTKNGESKETIVELDDSYIGMMTTDKEKVNQAAKEKFLRSK